MDTVDSLMLTSASNLIISAILAQIGGFYIWRFSSPSVYPMPPPPILLAEEGLAVRQVPAVSTPPSAG